MRWTWRPTSPSRPRSPVTTRARSRQRASHRPQTGEQIFTAAGCAGCHTFSPAGSNGTIGPDLNDLQAAATKYAKGQTPEEYVQESIVKPDAFLVPGFGNAMPSFEGRLTDKQIQTLVDYLLNSGG